MIQSLFDESRKCFVHIIAKEDKEPDYSFEITRCMQKQRGKPTFSFLNDLALNTFVSCLCLYN